MRNRKLSRSEPLYTGEGVGSVIRNSAYLLGGRFLTTLFRFLYALVLARKLGPKLYGLFSFGMAWYISFLFLANLGIGVILGREVGRDRRRGAHVSSQTLMLRAFFAFFTAILCGVVGWFLETNTETRRILIVFSLALFGRAVTTWAEMTFIAYEEAKYCFKLQVIFHPLEVVCGLVVLLAGGDVLGVAIVHAISWWSQALCGLAMVHRQIVKIYMVWTWEGFRNILSQGLPIGLGLFVVNWLQQGPLVLFRHTAGAGDSLGQLALSMQVFCILGIAPTAVVIASLPILSRSVARQDGKDVSFVVDMLRASLTLGTVLGLSGMALGPYIVGAVFGVHYTEAGHLLGPALCLLIPWTVGNTIMRVYFARGEFLLPTIAALGGATVLTFSMPWSVSAMQTSGAILAAGAGLGFWALILVLMLARSGELDLAQAVFRPGLAISLTVIVYFLLNSISAWSALLTSLLVLTGAVLILGVVKPNECSALWSHILRRFSSFQLTSRGTESTTNNQKSEYSEH